MSVIQKLLGSIMLFSALILTVESTAADTGEIELGPSCVTSDCHAEMSQMEFLHGPVNLGQCTPCHIAEGNKHVFEPLPTNLGSLCSECHEVEKEKKFVHRPFAEDCVVCHNPHGGPNRYFNDGGLGADGCFKCHDDVRSGLSMLHGPVAVGECLVCHTPHQSDNEALLVETRRELCIGCHVDVDLALEGMVSTHPPVKESCEGCHAAHGSNIAGMLKAPSQQICNECHTDFLEEMKNFKTPHQPVNDQKGCTNCHMAHASNQEKLLKQHTMDMCLDCHNQELDANGRTLHNIAEQLSQVKYLHGPLREKNCIACHEAHGSNHPFILEKDFPSQFYASYTEEAYDLCFDCHDKSLVEKKNHPTTGFRNGDENLHFLHVNREKGRSCRACHHEHGSNQPNHVRSEVPFGRWNMTLNFEKTATGGTCSTGCHVTYGYDREERVINAGAAGAN